jgi:SAM-dependent methyltransferase
MRVTPQRVTPTTGFVRHGPIHFQPIEWELAPLEPYLRGRVLNAGCGNRDVSALLNGFGATEVVNYDIASELPGAVIGSLDQMPFEAAEYDSVLCNAVLEHVESATRVMRELVRVVKPGGYLVVAIPFDLLVLAHDLSGLNSGAEASAYYPIWLIIQGPTVPAMPARYQICAARDDIPTEFGPQPFFTAQKVEPAQKP